jgi:hypothetical protein
MSTFVQRLVWRSVPVGVATALIGYGLSRLYLTAVEMFTSISLEENPDGRWHGPLIFGLAGFVISAAVECVRKDNRAATKQPAKTPVAAR